MNQVIAIILGGGRGTRLFPLTLNRSKPAVPIGGKYRLIDIPISNCINSGLRQVYVLTQYNSASLNRHVSRAYSFDHFSNGFVEILAAQQTPDDDHWYQGTADAVRQNMTYFVPKRHRYDYYVILSGDQLYSMDFRNILREHIANKAEITIATLPVNRESAKSFGIMKSDAGGRITEFVEKPKEDAILDGLKMPAQLVETLTEAGVVGLDEMPECFQASMGIYVFSRQALIDSLDNQLVDFGRDVIPRMIKGGREVFTHTFTGYWEDIGTIRSFYEANLDLCSISPQYDFFNSSSRIFTNARFLPASKVNRAMVTRSILSDGCILTDATIDNSLVGVRSRVENGSVLRRTVMMGADYYEDEVEAEEGAPPLGIGKGCEIEGAIIDKNARIGDGVKIRPHPPEHEYDDPEERYFIRQGIVVIPKNAVLPRGMEI